MEERTPPKPAFWECGLGVRDSVTGCSGGDSWMEDACELVCPQHSATEGAWPRGSLSPSLSPRACLGPVLTSIQPSVLVCDSQSQWASVPGALKVFVTPLRVSLYRSLCVTHIPRCHRVTHCPGRRWVCLAPWCQRRAQPMPPSPAALGQARLLWLLFATPAPGKHQDPAPGPSLTSAGP